jgi:hypothetical protein
MTAFHLKEVKGSATRRLFHRVPYLIYENDEEFIPYLEQDIEDVFNPRLNIVLQQGETRRWVLLHEDNMPCGRIAAYHYIAANGKITGAAGFFECINNPQAASVLFDAVDEFLKKRGIKSYQAPVNCGERDRFWGLLVSGFESPSYLQNYNPPYYRELFEMNGFVKEFEQYHYAVKPSIFPHSRFEKIAEWAGKNYGITARHFKEEEAEPFIRDVVQVYNQAWMQHEFYKPLSYSAAKKIFDSLHIVIDPELLWIAYAGNEPVGVFLAFRELNELFADFEGSISLWDKLKLKFKSKRIPVTKVQAFLFGVIPGHRQRGTDAVLIEAMAKGMKKFPELEFMELAWIGSFNHKMIHLMEKLKAIRSKVLFTYYRNI